MHLTQEAAYGGVVEPVSPNRNQKRSAHIIKPGAYRKTSLADDLAMLSDPRHPVDDGHIMNILVKYFFAYIYPGAEQHVAPLGDVSELFEEFYLIWRAEDEEKKKATPVFSECGYALRMLADLPKSAHILRSIVTRPLFNADVSTVYRGLDLGAGSGVLLLGAFAQAARHGFSGTRLWGVERDADVAERTRIMAGRLGLGEIITADARDAHLYDRFKDAPLTFVSNETIPPSFQRLRSEHFTSIHAALFNKCAPQLKETFFFPEALVVYEPKSKVSVALTPNNRFQPPRYYQHMHLYSQAVVIEGRMRHLHKLGRDFVKFVPRPFLEIMPGRW